MMTDIHPDDREAIKKVRMMSALPVVVVAVVAAVFMRVDFDWSNLFIGSMVGYAGYRIIWAEGIYHDARLLSEAREENARLSAENAEVYRELGRERRAA